MTWGAVGAAAIGAVAGGLGGGGGGGGQQTTGTSTTTPNPIAMQQYQSVLNRANQVGNLPLKQYSGPVVAGFTPQQQQGFQAVSNEQGVANPYINAAAGYIGSAATPINVPGGMSDGQLGYLSGQGVGYTNQAANTDIAGAGNSYLRSAMGSAGQGGAAGFGYGAQASGAGQGYGAAAFGSAQRGAAGALGSAYRPYDVSQYMSPYTQSVVDATQAQFNRGNAQQQQNVIGNAISHGAWGGDRSAIAQAELSEAQQAQQAPVIAGLYNQGYTNAQQEYNQQQGQQTQAQLSAGQLDLSGAQSAGQLGISGSQAAGQLGLSAGQLGAQTGLSGATTAQQAQAQQAALKQQSAQQLLGLYSGQQNTNIGAQEASGWLGLGAGSQMGALGTQAQNTALTDASALMSAGSKQQQLAQEQINVPYEQFQQQQAFPYQQTGWLANLSEGIGSGMGSTTTQGAPSPSMWGQVIGGASGAAGVYGQLKDAGAFGSSGGNNSTWDTSSNPTANQGYYTNSDGSIGTVARGGRIHAHGFAPGGTVSSNPYSDKEVDVSIDVPDVSTSFIPNTTAEIQHLQSGSSGNGGGGSGSSSSGGGSDIGGMIKTLAPLAKSVIGAFADGGRIEGFAPGGFIGRHQGAQRQPWQHPVGDLDHPQLGAQTAQWAAQNRPAPAPAQQQPQGAQPIMKGFGMMPMNPQGQQPQTQGGGSAPIFENNANRQAAMDALSGASPGQGFGQTPMNPQLQGAAGFGPRPPSMQGAPTAPTAFGGSMPGSSVGGMQAQPQVPGNPSGPVDQAQLGQLYQKYLGRAPDTMANGWLGKSVSDVTAGLQGSPEYKTDQLNPTYQKTLGRAPDAGGVAGFQGQSPESVYQNIIKSPEYAQQGSITGFNQASGRPGVMIPQLKVPTGPAGNWAGSNNADGSPGWMNPLAQYRPPGTTENTTTTNKVPDAPSWANSNGMITQDQVNQLYQTDLGRTPDQVGSSTVGNQTVGAVQKGILGSSEYQGLLKSGKVPGETQTSQTTGYNLPSNTYSFPWQTPDSGAQPASGASPQPGMQTTATSTTTPNTFSSWGSGISTGTGLGGMAPGAGGNNGMNLPNPGGPDRSVMYGRGGPVGFANGGVPGYDDGGDVPWSAAAPGWQTDQQDTETSLDRLGEALAPAVPSRRFIDRALHAIGSPDTHGVSAMKHLPGKPIDITASDSDGAVDTPVSHGASGVWDSPPPAAEPGSNLHEFSQPSRLDTIGPDVPNPVTPLASDTPVIGNTRVPPKPAGFSAAPSPSSSTMAASAPATAAATASPTAGITQDFSITPPPRPAESFSHKMANSPWAALTQAGAAMLSSRSPYFGQALGEGLNAANASLRDQAKQEEERNYKQGELDYRNQDIGLRGKELATRLEEFKATNSRESAKLAEDVRYHDIEAKHQGRMEGIEGMNAQTNAQRVADEKAYRDAIEDRESLRPTGRQASDGRLEYYDQRHKKTFLAPLPLGDDGKPVTMTVAPKPSSANPVRDILGDIKAKRYQWKAMNIGEPTPELEQQWEDEAKRDWEASNNIATASSTGSAAAPPVGQDIPTLGSDQASHDAYAKMPSGTKFRDAQGNIRTKP